VGVYGRIKTVPCLNQKQRINKKQLPLHWDFTLSDLKFSNVQELTNFVVKLNNSILTGNSDELNLVTFFKDPMKQTMDELKILRLETFLNICGLLD